MKSAANIGILLRTYFALGVAISLLALYQTQVQTQALLKLRTRYKWAILMLVFAVNVAAGMYAIAQGERTRYWKHLISRRIKGVAGVALGLCLMLLPVPLFLYARADFFGRGLEAFFRLLWLFWWLALIQAFGLKLISGLDWPRAFAAVLLLDGATAKLSTLGAAVSDYPFSMGWSEASRYYYASLVFAKSIYGESLPLSVMHGTRYFLQAIPYFFGSPPLWAARLWQALLWIGLTLGASVSMVRRLKISRRLDVVLLVSWLFLFFFQGAVYYHLQVGVILVMQGVNLRKPWRSLLAVSLASAWAGMSRVNWFPVPAMLAITLYLLERPYSSARSFWEYVRRPALWGTVGLVAAALGQAFYIRVSGNANLEAFASSFTSALLWYRWLPSPTNPIGIIPGVLLVSAPLLSIICWRLLREPGLLNWMRLAPIATMLAILLAGGLIVSTKIGGGGDLHNMDAYLVMLACLGLFSLCGSAAAEIGKSASKASVPIPSLTVAVLVPVAFSLLQLGNYFRYDAARAQAEIATLGREVQAYGKLGNVLFMYERHLQTFGMVPKVRMVAPYEVVTLMEMAISGNAEYLGQFYEDLQSHRFAAIVAHPQNLGVETGDFIEENDAWTRSVARPLLCFYKPSLTLDYSNTQILVPRARPCPEPPAVVGPQ